MSAFATTLSRISTAATTAPSILIVEGDTLAGKEVPRMLKGLGYRVAGQAATGEEATLLALELKPDLVLVDTLVHGKLDGIETGSALKELLSVPIVYVAAAGDDAAMERAVRAEPLGFLMGPIRAPSLRCTIELALSRHRLECALREREEMFRSLSLIDDLTELYNRRGFLTLAEQQLKVARRNGEPLVLFFCDLDGLKQINDELGHQQGDRAIKEAARILKQTFRDPDLVSRLAGDEFAVLALRATEDSAALVLKRLRANVAFWNARNDTGFRLSLSVGVSVVDPIAGDGIAASLARADTEMYLSKRARRGEAA
jgi:diguanylate cyclase (GGDEF)-like protein